MLKTMVLVICALSLSVPATPLAGATPGQSSYFDNAARAPEALANPGLDDQLEVIRLRLRKSHQMVEPQSERMIEAQLGCEVIARQIAQQKSDEALFEARYRAKVAEENAKIRVAVKAVGGPTKLAGNSQVLEFVHDRALQLAELVRQRQRAHATYRKNRRVLTDSDARLRTTAVTASFDDGLAPVAQIEDTKSEPDKGKPRPPLKPNEVRELMEIVKKAMVEPDPDEANEDDQPRKNSCATPDGKPKDKNKNVDKNINPASRSADAE